MRVAILIALVVDELALQLALAQATAGRLMRNSIDRTVREINTFRRDAMKIEFEIMHAKTTALSGGAACAKP